MKITGAELARFIADDGGGWPSPSDDWYWDHEVFDQVADLDPAGEYDTDEIGPVLYRGSGTDPTRGNGYNLATLIKKWRKARDFDVLTITVPKGDTEMIKKMLQQAGVDA